MSSTSDAHSPEALIARLQQVHEHRSLRQVNGHRPSEADLRKVASGGVITGLLESSGGGNRAYGLAVVPLPISRFWAALNDETRHPGYTPVAYSELLEGRPCAAKRKVLQYLPVPMMSDRWWIGMLSKNQRVQTASGGAVRELSWSSSTDASLVKTESGQKMISQAVPIGFSKGAWFLVALDERSTYVEYYLHSDPGGRIPAGMARMFATRGVRQAIEAIQKFAQEAKPACAIE